MIQHKELGAGRWKDLSFCEQMANIGSEVERTIQWKKKVNSDYSQRAFDRALELLDFTIEDQRNKKRVRELVRVREALADHFTFDNEYQSTNSIWQSYFCNFNFAARKDR